MEGILNDVVVSITPMVVAVVGAILSMAIKKFSTYITTMTDNKKVEFAIERLTFTTNTVVTALSQTVVDGVKKASEDGKLSLNDAKEIKSNAINEVLNIMNKDMIDIIKGHVGDFDKFIDDKVEQSVTNLKL